MIELKQCWKLEYSKHLQSLVTSQSPECHRWHFTWRKLRGHKRSVSFPSFLHRVFWVMEQPTRLSNNSNWKKSSLISSFWMGWAKNKKNARPIQIKKKILNCDTGPDWYLCIKLPGSSRRVPTGAKKSFARAPRLPHFLNNPPHCSQCSTLLLNASHCFTLLHNPPSSSPRGRNFSSRKERSYSGHLR